VREERFGCICGHETDAMTLDNAGSAGKLPLKLGYKALFFTITHLGFTQESYYPADIYRKRGFRGAGTRVFPYRGHPLSASMKVLSF